MANIITITGHLGQDVEQVNTDNGNKCFKLSVATTEKWKNKNGEETSLTTWHRCNLWGNYEKLAQYLIKGTQVLIVGTQRHETYPLKDSNGNQVYIDGREIKQNRSYINVSKVELLGSPRNGQNDQQQNNPHQQPDNNRQNAKNDYIPQSDDLPF